MPVGIADADPPKVHHLRRFGEVAGALVQVGKRVVQPLEAVAHIARVAAREAGRVLELLQFLRGDADAVGRLDKLMGPRRVLPHELDHARDRRGAGYGAHGGNDRGQRAQHGPRRLADPVEALRDLAQTAHIDEARDLTRHPLHRRAHLRDPAIDRVDAFGGLIDDREGYTVASHAIWPALAPRARARRSGATARPTRSVPSRSGPRRHADPRTRSGSGRRSGLAILAGRREQVG